MSEKTMVCHACLEKTVVFGLPGRRDECDHCTADLRCCLNCRFYDRSHSNECREIISERVVNKERGNFCVHFEASDHAGRTVAAKTEVIDIAAKFAESLAQLKAGK